MPITRRAALKGALATVVEAGATPFAIAAVQGGDDFWHPRASGVDSGAMVVDEFLPLLADRGLQTDRIAFLGWSMGGYGSLLLASQLGPERVAAVVAESPALWPDYELAPAIAFDDAADYDKHGVFGHQNELDGIPVRVDCGDKDEFFAISKAYVAGFANPPAGGFQAGGHDFTYWSGVAPEQLAFVAEQF